MNMCLFYCLSSDRNELVTILAQIPKIGSLVTQTSKLVTISNWTQLVTSQTYMALTFSGIFPAYKY